MLAERGLPLALSPAGSVVPGEFLVTLKNKPLDRSSGIVRSKALPPVFALAALAALLALPALPGLPALEPPLAEADSGVLCDAGFAFALPSPW